MPKIPEFIKLRNELLRLRKKIAGLKAKEKELCRELQKKCLHETVVEKEYEWSGNPREKLCLLCGFTESDFVFPKMLQATPIRKNVPAKEYYRLKDLQPLKELLIPEDFV